MSHLAPVVLDADVLVPMPLCDTLLRMAYMGLFAPHWSSETVHEVERTLIRLGRDPEKVRLRIAAMTAAFPNAVVTDHQTLIPVMQNNEKDRHIVAAAVTVSAGVIVTRNLKHFTPLPPMVEAVSPDAFLLEMWEESPSKLIQAINQQVVALGRPAMTTGELLDRLALTVPLFAIEVRKALNPREA